MENKNYDNNKKENTDKKYIAKNSILNNPQNDSTLRDNLKKRTSFNSKVYINMKEEVSKKKFNNLSIKEIQDKEIQDLYLLLLKPNKERNRKDNIEIFLFLLKTRIKENFKSDLLHTGYNLDSLFNFVIPYISVEVYNSGDMIYSYGDEAQNFYLILKGNIGQYKLVKTEKSMSSEDYYFYLSEKFTYFKKTMIDKSVENNSNIYLDENEYTDIDLIRRMANINKDVYPLNSFDDMEDLLTIIIEIKLYMKLVENRPNNEIIEIFTKFNFPLTYLNVDKLVSNNISVHNFLLKLSKRIKQREQFYMKILGKTTEYKVKLMKYIKVENLKPYDYFGNFEIIDTKPIRNDTARCEGDNTILLSFNKKAYSKIINSLQKEKIEKEITFLHSSFYFRNVNKLYFESKMFIKYRIDNYLKGNILINQGEKINNFIFVREGTIETSVNNVSLLELANKIKILQEFIITKAKEFDVNIKDLLDFDLSLNHKTNLEFELIEGILKQKQSFILSRTEKGCFGEYEYYFKTPSFVTVTIISKNAKVYFYDYKNFAKIKEEVHSFNEFLKETSFSKLKSTLKRMISIYNSYFQFNMKQLETKILENENKLKNLNSTNTNSIKNETEYNYNFNDEQQKHFSSPFSQFQKNTISRFHFINTNNEYNNSKDSLEKNSSINKIKDINLFSSDIEKIKKYRQNTLSQIKGFKTKIENNLLKRNIINLKTNLNKNKRPNINIKAFSTEGSFKEKKILSLKNKKKNKTKSINILKKKKIINTINDFILKTENPQRKQFNVFLPPLSTNENKSKNESSKIENLKINYHFFKHSISIANSINDVSLGHKDNIFSSDNSEDLGLSNIDKKKSKDYNKKSRSINIKRAQINIIKNRSIKRKKVMKKKKEENSFYDEDL